MLQKWTCKNKEGGFDEMSVVVHDFSFNSSRLVFPILTSFSENSEHSLIQLKYMYDSCVAYMNNVLFCNKDSYSFKTVPYDIVDAIDLASKLFVGYLRTIGVDKYFPETHKFSTALDPSESRPFCDVFYCSIQDALTRLNDDLYNRGISLSQGFDLQHKAAIDTGEESDTDWN